MMDVYFAGGSIVINVVVGTCATCLLSNKPVSPMCKAVCHHESAAGESLGMEIFAHTR